MTKYSNKLALVLLSIIALIGVGFVTFRLVGNNGGDRSSAESAGTSHHKINYSPPSDSEKNQSDSIKDQQPTGAAVQPPKSSDGRRPVTVVISQKSPDSSGYATVNGYVADIVESGGTCVLAMTKDDETVTASRPAEPNATNTTCGKSKIAISKLSPGDWKTILTYTSAKYKGVSEPETITIKAKD